MLIENKIHESESDVLKKSSRYEYNEESERLNNVNCSWAGRKSASGRIRFIILSKDWFNSNMRLRLFYGEHS